MPPIAAVIIKFSLVYLARAHNSRAGAGNRATGSKNVPAPRAETSGEGYGQTCRTRNPIAQKTGCSSAAAASRQAIGKLDSLFFLCLEIV